MRLSMVVPDLPPALNAAMEGLVLINVTMMIAALLAGRPLPLLYASGIRYGREPKGREWWQTVGDNFSELARLKRTRKISTTDCEDLATARTGELRFGALLAELLDHDDDDRRAALLRVGRCPQLSFQIYPAVAVCIRTGPKSYHAIVKHPDGHIEDPSRALGMKAPPLLPRRSRRP